MATDLEKKSIRPPVPGRLVASRLLSICLLAGFLFSFLILLLVSPEIRRSISVSGTARRCVLRTPLGIDIAC